MTYSLSGKIRLQHCNDTVLRHLFPIGRGVCFFGRTDFIIFNNIYNNIVFIMLYGRIYSNLVGECGLLPPVRDKGGCIGKGIVPSTYFKLQGKLAVVRIKPHSFCLYFPECFQASKLRRWHVKILTLLLFKLLKLIIDKKSFSRIGIFFTMRFHFAFCYSGKGLE